MGRDRISIGCGVGFAVDRIPPGVEIVECAKLDYLAMECLAERTRQEPECAAAHERPSWSQ
jgi:hypothetical protein